MKFFLFKTYQRYKKIREKEPAYLLSIFLISIFSLLVLLGVTGSSFLIGTNASSSFIDTENIKSIGKSKPIRSDEWLVFTPYLMAQKNHNPAFPVINNNIGIEGQNMLVVGMGGMPIRHVSSIAKPATWGFFLFDLKRAMAWYWWFPFFGCLIALWTALNDTVSKNWKLNFLASLLFCVSPYAVAWSLWPLYATFFPCLILISSLKILRSKQSNNLFNKNILWTVTLGLSTAGLVLILYPPWIILLGFIFIFILSATVVQEKLYKDINLYKVLWIITSMCICSFVLWHWWIDGREAIKLMQNTVYPGHRESLQGGGYTLNELLRGFSNLISLHSENEFYTNKSEISSYFFFIPILFLIYIYNSIKYKINILDTLMIGLLLFILYYIFYGMPLSLTKSTLFNFIPNGRVDLAIGLITTFLSVSQLNTATKMTKNVFHDKYYLLLILLSLLWASVVLYCSSSILNNYLKVSHLQYIPLIMIFFFTFIASQFLFYGEKYKFYKINIVFALLTTITFNPVVIFPNQINLKSNLFNSYDKVLTIENEIWANYLVAAGVKVIDSTSYYPQFTLWRKLDPNGLNESIYNRYQHLIFALKKQNIAPYFSLSSPQADVVLVTVDPEHFDFNLTSATKIVVNDSQLSLLSKNKSLYLVDNKNNFAIFNVVVN